MIDSNNAAALIGGTVVDNDGNKIGAVGQLYVDPASGQPNWATVKTGLFGTSETFVPLEPATADGDTIRVPYEKAFVKDAPRIEADGPLEPADEQRLYDYYRLGGESAASSRAEDTSADTTGGTGIPEAATTGHDTSGPETDDAMTRSEERLHVGTERVDSGRARLR
jgi:sporulation protein YlmC with PRC-barrel domain